MVWALVMGQVTAAFVGWEPWMGQVTAAFVGWEPWMGQVTEGFVGSQGFVPPAGHNKFASVIVTQQVRPSHSDTTSSPQS